MATVLAVEACVCGLSMFREGINLIRECKVTVDDETEIKCGI